MTINIKTVKIETEKGEFKETFNCLPFTTLNLNTEAAWTKGQFYRSLRGKNIRKCQPFQNHNEFTPNQTFLSIV